MRALLEKTPLSRRGSLGRAAVAGAGLWLAGRGEADRLGDLPFGSGAGYDGPKVALDFWCGFTGGDGDAMLDAVAWGTFMAINLLWPRKDVYNATEPFHWYLQYGAMLFIGVVFFGGLAYYWLVQRHKTGVLASHAFQSPSDVVPSPQPAQSP